MNIEVTEQEMDIIMRSLIQQPYANVARLIPKLMEQANAAKTPVAVPAPAAQ